MDTDSTDRLRMTSEESQSFLRFQDLPNDPDKINEFKKALEDYVIDDESDMIGDMSQIVPDSRPYDTNAYDSILLNARSARSICQKFESEPCGLLKSDAQGVDFSLDGILSRMKTGHKVYKYNYNTPTRKIVTVKIDLNIIEIYKSENMKSRIGFSEIYGLTLGSSSSTFKMYKGQIDYKFGKIHTQEDCFSVISEFRSYDFATNSAMVKYDICLSLSWLCSLNNSLQSNVPFTKCNTYADFLAYKNISDKLKRDAKLMYISLNELFLVTYIQLAIYKTMKQMENNAGMNKIVMILNKRFSFSGKMYRFIRFIVMPLIMGDSYTRRELKDKIRVNLLVGNKLKSLSASMDKLSHKEEEKLVAKTKKTILESMTVPGCKSIFKKSKTTDPFLAALRKEIKSAE